MPTKKIRHSTKEILLTEEELLARFKVAVATGTRPYEAKVQLGFYRNKYKGKLSDSIIKQIETICEGIRVDRLCRGPAAN